ADDQDLSVFNLGTDLLDHCTVLRDEGLRSWRRSSLATRAPGCHVGELEAGDGDAANGEQICYCLEEGACHRAACPVGQDEAHRRIHWSRFEKFSHRHRLGRGAEPSFLHISEHILASFGLQLSGSRNIYANSGSYMRAVAVILSLILAMTAAPSLGAQNAPTPAK